MLFNSCWDWLVLIQALLFRRKTIKRGRKSTPGASTNIVRWCIKRKTTGDNSLASLLWCKTILRFKTEKTVSFLFKGAFLAWPSHFLRLFISQWRHSSNTSSKRTAAQRYTTTAQQYIFLTVTFLTLKAAKLHTRPNPLPEVPDRGTRELAGCKVASSKLSLSKWKSVVL